MKTIAKNKTWPLYVNSISYRVIEKLWNLGLYICVYELQIKSWLNKPYTKWPLRLVSYIYYIGI